jgi:hypothetical protein
MVNSFEINERAQGARQNTSEAGENLPDDTVE